MRLVKPSICFCATFLNVIRTAGAQIVVLLFLFFAVRRAGIFCFMGLTLLESALGSPSGDGVVVSANLGGEEGCRGEWLLLLGFFIYLFVFLLCFVCFYSLSFGGGWYIVSSFVLSQSFMYLFFSCNHIICQLIVVFYKLIQ